MANSITIYKDTVEEEAQHTIGLCYPDRFGFHWSYVEFVAGTYNKGNVVADQAPSTGTISTSVAVGSELLIDTGEFDGDDLRGAIGTLVTGGGAGQSFIVIDTLDANKLKIQLLGKRGPGWETAPVGGTTTYALQMPGRVVLGTETAKTRGVWQGGTFTVPSGQFRYGFVRQQGIGEGLLDNDGDANAAVAANGIVIPSGATSGKIEGSTTAIAATEVFFAIGRSLVALNKADQLIPIDFDINNRTRSFRAPRKREEPRISVS